MDRYIFSWLVLRLVLAWMYLYPIIGLMKDREGLMASTKLLFPWKTAFFAYVSIGAMIIGALSILFGFYAQIGGFILLIFTLGGIRVHYALAAQAKPALNNPQVRALAKLALLGHISSAEKNFVLAAVALMIMLLGSGPLSLTGNIF